MLLRCGISNKSSLLPLPIGMVPVGFFFLPGVSHACFPLVSYSKGAAMKFVVDSQAFSKVLVRASSVVPSRTSLPIMQCLLLDCDAKAKVMSVCYSNNGSVMRWYVPGVDIQRSGQAVVEPGRLSHLLAELAGDVTISLHESKGVEELVLAATFFESELTLHHHASAYPSCDEVEVGVAGTAFVNVQREDFLRAVKLCSFASKKASNLKFAIDGVTFWPIKSKDGFKSLDVVGTDGKVLVLSSLDCTPGDGKLEERHRSAPSLLHNSFVPLVGSVFEEDPAEYLVVSPGAHAVVIKSQRSYVRCVCSNGSYPDYAALFGTMMNRGKTIDFSVVAVDFIHSIRLAAICCDPEYPSIKLKLGEGTLFASANVPEGSLITGRSRAEMPIPVDGGGAEMLIMPSVFLSITGVFREADMIDFRVNLQTNLALFACTDIKLQGILVLQDRKN